VRAGPDVGSVAFSSYRILFLLSALLLPFPLLVLRPFEVELGEVLLTDCPYDRRVIVCQFEPFFFRTWVKRFFFFSLFFRLTFFLFLVAHDDLSPVHVISGVLALTLLLLPLKDVYFFFPPPIRTSFFPVPG